MRYLLAFLILAPVMAQQPEPPQAKPDAAAAQSTAAPDQQASNPPDQKPADQAAADQKAAASPEPTPPGDNWFSGSIDMGYRALLNNSGNFLEYRSVVNLGEGARVFGLDFTIQDPKKRLFDRVTGYGYGFGDPNNIVHADARKQGIYNFTVDYRHIAYFNAVPSYANPFQPAGLNQQTFDTYRRNTSFSLDLFPGKRIIPYVAYDRNSGTGHGIWDFVMDNGTNSYAVPSIFRDGTQNVRGGVHLEWNHYHATLEQGWTGYRNDDSAYNTVFTTGNRTTPLFGQTLFLTNLTQSYGIRGDGIYEKGLLTANPFPWMDLYGQFLYSQPSIDVHYNDFAQGNFADLTTLLFYNTLQTTAAGSANQPHITANGGFEIRPLKHMRIIESLSTDREHDAASPLMVEQLASKTATQTIATALNYHQVVNYNQEQVDILYDLGSKLTLRAGYRALWGDATVLASQLSQSGRTESGLLRRNIGLGGVTFHATKKLTAHADFEGGLSDNIYFRTSLNNYTKANATAKYQATTSVTLQARFQVLDNQNPDPTIRFDYLSRNNVLQIFWTPNSGKYLTLTGEYDRSTVRSTILYRDLFLVPTISDYRDNAHTATAAVSVIIPRYPQAKLTFGGSLFISSGSRPTRLYEPLVRFSIPLIKHLAWNTEWQYYGYGEPFYIFEGFRANIFMTGIRLSK